MKHLIVFLFSFLSLHISAQTQGIGLHTTYSESDGLQAKLSYEHNVGGSHLFRLGAGSNFNLNHNAEFSYQYQLLSTGKLSLFSGLGVKLDFNDYSEFNHGRTVTSSLMLPIDLRYKLSQDVSVNIGLSPVLYRFKKNEFKAQDGIQDYRLGLIYNF